MTRSEHVRRVLDNFEVAYPLLAPLKVETVWHHSWTAEEVWAFNRRSRWRKATGVYLFVDFCAAGDIHGEPEGERYSVIRRIGKADYAFADRTTDYGHRVRGNPGVRQAWGWWDGDWQEWFRSSQIDIVRIPAASAYLLETFLLARIPTQCNDKDVPAALKDCPIIYDAGKILATQSEALPCRYRRT